MEQITNNVTNIIDKLANKQNIKTFESNYKKC